MAVPAAQALIAAGGEAVVLVGELAVDPDAQVGALEKEGVRNSIANLHGFPFVAEAVADGLLSLSGAWVDIGPGKLYALNPGTDVFEEV